MPSTIIAILTLISVTTFGVAMLKSTRLKKGSVLIDSKLAAQQLLEVLVALQSNCMKLDEPRDFANELGLTLGNMYEDND